MSSGFQGFSGNNFTQYSSLSFHTVEAVVVSGTTPNFCGHMLLRIDNYYFHISSVYNNPSYMEASQFNRYLKENKKVELFRSKRLIRNKAAAKKQLQKLMGEKWLWLILPSNCTDFVEEVIGAGENDFGLISNCPTQLSIKIQQELRRLKMTLTRRGYRIAR